MIFKSTVKPELLQIPQARDPKYSDTHYLGPQSRGGCINGVDRRPVDKGNYHTHNLPSSVQHRSSQRLHGVSIEGTGSPLTLDGQVNKLGANWNIGNKR